jgi:hypothetical protein
MLGRLVTLATVLAISASAHAQASPAPDIVRLADGSFYRGIIVESTPDHVSLLLASGETREFARALVRSAERETPAAEAPLPAPPRAPVTHLRAHADVEHLTLERITGRANAAAVGGYGEVRVVSVDRFEEICVMPCERDLAPDTVQFGLAYGRGGARRVGAPITLEPGELTLDVHYEDRQPIRIVGLVTAILGGAGGYALTMIGAFLDRAGGQANLPEIGAGVGLFVVGMAVGLPLAFWWDSSEIHARVGDVDL